MTDKTPVSDIQPVYLTIDEVEEILRMIDIFPEGCYKRDIQKDIKKKLKRTKSLFNKTDK